MMKANRVLLLLFFYIKECVTLSHFENILLKEQLERSRYHINNENEVNISESSTHSNMPSPTSFREEFDKRKLYQPLPSSTLVAIIHSSEVIFNT